MTALRKAHADRLSVQFDDREAEKDREIDILTREITQHFNNAGARLQKLVSKDRAALIDAESKIMKNLQRCRRRADVVPVSCRRRPCCM